MNGTGNATDSLDWGRAAARIPVVLMAPVQIVGLLGNAVSILIFRRMLRSSVNILFLALAVADGLILILSGLLYLPIGFFSELHHLASYRSHIALMSLVAYPLSNMAQTAAVYFLLLISLERYIAVAFPLAVTRLCTARSAAMGIVGVVLLSVAFNAVKFREHGLAWSQEGQHWDAEARPLKNDWHYRRVYTMWSHIILMFLLPFSAFLALNVRIIAAVHKARKERRRLSRSQMKEQEVTMMILAVVVFFILANILPFVLAVTDALMPQEKMSPEWQRISYTLSDVCNLLVQLNSAANAVIYYRFNAVYRRSVHQYRLFRHCFPKQYAKEMERSQLSRPNTLLTFNLETPTTEEAPAAVECHSRGLEWEAREARETEAREPRRLGIQESQLSSLL